MTRRPRPLTNLASEDRVVLFPSLGHLSRDGEHWIVDVHGDVSAAGRLDARQADAAQAAASGRCGPAMKRSRASCFSERIARFVAVDRPGRRIAVRIGERVVPLPKKTRRNGHFQAAVRVPVDLCSRWCQPVRESRSLLPLDVCQSDRPAVDASGQVHLLGRTGLSIISDIDDTLKHSLRRLQADAAHQHVPAAVRDDSRHGGAVSRMVGRGSGVSLRLVQPWQLYEHLAEHLAAEGFPAGSFHLRAFRLRDHLLRRLLMLRRSGKAERDSVARQDVPRSGSSSWSATPASTIRRSTARWPAAFLSKSPASSFASSTGRTTRRRATPAPSAASIRRWSGSIATRKSSATCGCLLVGCIASDAPL